MSERFVSGVSAKVALYEYSSFPFLSFPFTSVCYLSIVCLSSCTQQS